MNYLQNHIWCSDSNWGNHYDCRHLVNLNSYEDHDKEDWSTILCDETLEYFDEATYERMKEIYKDQPLVEGEYLVDDKYLRRYSTRHIYTIRNEVIEWLVKNVADRPNPPEGQSSAGWCVPSFNSRCNENESMTFFFHRRSDAMAFIRRFSKWKKPVHYCQYFSDDRKRLNLETMKYEKE